MTKAQGRGLRTEALQARRRIPRSFKELTPTRAFNPRTFFREMVWKALLTRRTGKEVLFSGIKHGQSSLEVSL